MRIQDNSSNVGASALGQTAQTQATGSTSKGSAAQSSATEDGVDLSTFAGSLSKIMQSDSASRAQRVSQLTAAVRSGTYQVDPQAVSRALVDHIVSSSQSAE
jgi:flagellar biosynthesis anti-sigma factor FlgM